MSRGEERPRKWSENSTKIRRKPNCNWLWTWASIGWDGSVRPCCHIFDASGDFGNMSDKPFRKIWNNAEYRASRRFSSKGKIGDLRTICMDCPDATYSEEA